VHGVNPKLVRRTTTVRLVQIIAGGSLGEAAEYLGINPTGKQYVSSERVHRWARNQPDPREFEAALHALADQLDAAPRLVNYQQRRNALNNWALSPERWHGIVVQLPPTPGRAQDGHRRERDGKHRDHGDRAASTAGSSRSLRQLCGTPLTISQSPGCSRISVFSKTKTDSPRTCIRQSMEAVVCSAEAPLAVP
jgi:hypothetical protein